MASSIRDNIIKAFKANIETITAIKEVNTEIKGTSEYSSVNTPAVEIVDGRETKNPGDINSTYCLLPVHVIGYIKKDNYGDNIQDTRREIQSSIEKKIMNDQTVGGDAEQVNIEWIDTDKGIFENETSFEMQFMVKYYHDRGNPESQSNSPTFSYT